jgi:hypothetical protein
MLCGQAIGHFDAKNIDLLLGQQDISRIVISAKAGIQCKGWMPDQVGHDDTFAVFNCRCNKA